MTPWPYYWWFPYSQPPESVLRKLAEERSRDKQPAGEKKGE